MIDRRDFLIGLGVSALVCSLPLKSSYGDAVAECSRAGLDPFEIISLTKTDHEGEHIECPMWWMFSDRHARRIK